MKLAWVTDIHLNFLDKDEVAEFCGKIIASKTDALLVGGDIAESNDLIQWLVFMEERLQRPIYFVLGNHDYYGSSVHDVREKIIQLTNKSKWLHWLNNENVLPLSDSWALVGVDGWGDARYGNYNDTTVQLTDSVRIRDLIGLDKKTLGEQLRALGDMEAKHLRGVLAEALNRFEEVLVLTHVPPFIEACWYEGKTSDANWAPFFSCKAVGDVLLEAMKTHPDRKTTVLCGHTHSPGKVEILPNLLVRTGKAKYHLPEIQIPLIEID